MAPAWCFHDCLSRSSSPWTSSLCPHLRIRTSRWFYLRFRKLAEKGRLQQMSTYPVISLLDWNQRSRFLNSDFHYWMHRVFQRSTYHLMACQCSRCPWSWSLGQMCPVVLEIAAIEETRCFETGKCHCVDYPFLENSWVLNTYLYRWHRFSALGGRLT